MKNINIHSADSKDCSAKQLGDHVLTVLSDAIRCRGAAYLVVSGGSTPVPLFRYLSEAPIDWRKVTVTLADERCVEPIDESSNAKLVREEFLQGNASQANFVSLFDGGVAHMDDQIAAGLKLLKLPRYDMVILGMGDDGHTASIFPSAKNRDSALDLNENRLALLTDPITQPQQRITQTARRLLNTQNLVIHFSGQDKASLFKEVLNRPNSENWPISFFLTQEKVPVDVFTDIPTLKGFNGLNGVAA